MYFYTLALTECPIKFTQLHDKTSRQFLQPAESSRFCMQ